MSETDDELLHAHYTDFDARYTGYVLFLIEYHGNGIWQRYGQAGTLEAAQAAVKELSEAPAKMPWRIIKKTVTYEPQKVQS